MSPAGGTDGKKDIIGGSGSRSGRGGPTGFSPGVRESHRRGSRGSGDSGSGVTEGRREADRIMGLAGLRRGPLDQGTHGVRDSHAGAGKSDWSAWGAAQEQREDVNRPRTPAWLRAGTEGEADAATASSSALGGGRKMEGGAGKRTIAGTGDGKR